MKSRLNHAIVAAALLLVALALFGLGVLYLVYAFHAWLASEMAAPYAALITAGAVFALASAVVLALSLRRSRPQPKPAEQARQLGGAVGMAAFSRLLLSLFGRISPRMIVMALAAAAAVFLVSFLWRRNGED